jgi:hypothetical protein
MTDLTSAQNLVELLESLRDCKLVKVYEAIQKFDNYLLRTPYLLNTEVGATYKANLDILKTEIEKKYMVSFNS